MSRGIRNNNSGNIRHGAKWQGLAKVQNDKDFCTFETAEYGIRALTVLLKTYYHKHNFKTVTHHRMKVTLIITFIKWPRI